MAASSLFSVRCVLGFGKCQVRMRLCACICGLICLDYWARVWSEHSESDPANARTSFYVGIYALFNLTALIAASFWFGRVSF